MDIKKNIPIVIKNLLGEKLERAPVINWDERFNSCGSISLILPTDLVDKGSVVVGKDNDDRIFVTLYIIYNNNPTIHTFYQKFKNSQLPWDYGSTNSTIFHFPNHVVDTNNNFLNKEVYDIIKELVKNSTYKNNNNTFILP